jgi:uncharacterized membrane protein HdeD (DUF308 family)
MPFDQYPFHQSLYHGHNHGAAALEATPATPATPCVTSLDMSIVYMAMIAATTVFIGTYEATRAMVVRRAIREQRLVMTEQMVNDEAEMPELVMTWQMAAVYVGGASGGLLLLYFFMDSLIGILTILITLGSVVVMYLLVENWVATCRGCASNRILQIVLGALCVAFGLLYYFTREDNYSWALQDILCPMLCIYIIRTFTVPNLKVSCILLSALICYDIFWVYIRAANPRDRGGPRAPLCAGRFYSIPTRFPLNTCMQSDGSYLPTAPAPG